MFIRRKNGVHFLPKIKESFNKQTISILTITAIVTGIVVIALTYAGIFPVSSKLAPELQNALKTAGPTDTLQVIASFKDRKSLEEFVPSVSAKTGFIYQAVPSIAFTATPREVALLTQRPEVIYVESNAKIPVLLPTATEASRAQAVWGTFLNGPIRDRSGKVIDGQGVGVAIVDSGVYGLHKDLQGAMAQNFKVVPDPNAVWVGQPDVLIPLDNTDTTSGHGTHVAGIVASSGASSGGQVKGAAPGAKVYGFGAGEGVYILTASAAASFDWIIENHDKVSPNIMVVNNSWGNAGVAYDPNNIISRLTNEMIEQGIVVVYAAGNGADIGETDQPAEDSWTTGQARNPTPGVISVAIYSDLDSGSREVSAFSWGNQAFPSTWPDISAPGSTITSLFNPTGGLSWLGKLICNNADGSNCNYFPAYTHPLDGHHIKFTFGNKSGGDFLTLAKPTVIYNAHLGRSWPNAQFPTDQPRLYSATTPFGAGPVVPKDQAKSFVTNGDTVQIIRNVKEVARTVVIKITSPSGTTKLLTRDLSACPLPPCNDTIDLNAHFANEPSDGTWILTIAIAVDPTTKTTSGFDYVIMTGSSMAAPHVAAVAALLFQANPNLTPAQIEDILEDTAHKLPSVGYIADPNNPDNTSSPDRGGHGLVDAQAAVNFVLNQR